jgi:two-component system LytT family response regulator
MYSAIVIEDVKIIRESTVELIKKLAPDINIIAEAGTVREAWVLINQLDPDILFLDVELKDGSAFDLLKGIDALKYKIVFITAYNHYAIEAIKHAAIDYVLKPIRKEELQKAIERVRGTFDAKLIEKKLKELLSSAQSIKLKESSIALKTFDRIFKVDIKDIIFCNSDNSYTTFHLTNGKKIVVSVSIKEYERELGKYNFHRIHQSYLVNLSMVDYFNKQDDFIVMKNGVNVPVSTRKKEYFLSVFQNQSL